MNGKKLANFWTSRGVQQGCSISPTLFSVNISNIEEYMKADKLGGIVVGKRKFMTLSYADDLALMAKRRGNDVEKL